MRVEQDVLLSTDADDTYTKSELLTIMIVTIFFDSIVGKNWFQFIFGTIDHNSMILNFQLDHDLGVD